MAEATAEEDLGEVGWVEDLGAEATAEEDLGGATAEATAQSALQPAALNQGETARKMGSSTFSDGGGAGAHTPLVSTSGTW